MLTKEEQAMAFSCFHDGGLIKLTQEGEPTFLLRFV